jgi:hypothetical protein
MSLLTSTKQNDVTRFLDLEVEVDDEEEEEEEEEGTIPFSEYFICNDCA